MADEESTTEEVIEEAETAVEDAAVDERPLPEEAVLAGIVEPHLSATWVIAPDEWVVTVDSAEYHGLVALARQSGFDTFIDLCAVDYFRRDPRFEVVVTLLDYSTPMRLRVRVGVAAEEPALVTISDLFIGANFYEREAYDMYGIEFTGHPDLTRILMPDDWEGHPLRKDYAVGAVPVQFKDAPKAQ